MLQILKICYRWLRLSLVKLSSMSILVKYIRMGLEKGELRMHVRQKYSRFTFSSYPFFFFVNTEKTILNKVVEIPRWANAKLRVIGMHGYITKNWTRVDRWAREIPRTPLSSKIPPRRISLDCNYFLHKDYVWNQDAFKSTWIQQTSLELTIHWDLERSQSFSPWNQSVW